MNTGNIKDLLAQEYNNSLEKQIHIQNSSDSEEDSRKPDEQEDDEEFTAIVASKLEKMRTSEDKITNSYQFKVAEMLANQMTKHPQIYSKTSDFLVPISNLFEKWGIKRTKHTLNKLIYKLLNKYDFLKEAYDQFKQLKKKDSNSYPKKNTINKTAEKIERKWLNINEIIAQNQLNECDELWKTIGTVRPTLYENKIPNTKLTEKEIAAAKEMEKKMYQINEKPPVITNNLVNDSMVLNTKL